jgi:hypothetical protein
MVTRRRRALRALTLIAALAASAAPAPAADPPAPSPWTILFRSDDPTLWNTTSGKPDDPNGFALPLSAAPDAIRYLRIKRMDTGDYIIFRGNFKSVPGTGASLAWIDGSVTWPAGSTTGTYLGIADRASISLEKNDAMLYRGNGRDGGGSLGWGFGKRPSTNAQAYAWAGQAIKQTIFEIAALATDVTPDERPWVAQNGVVKLISATWGGDDGPTDVTATLRSRLTPGLYPFRADPALLGPPGGAGEHSVHIAYSLNGIDHDEVYKEGDAIRLCAPAMRTLGPNERKPGDLTIASATWSADGKSIDVAKTLRDAIKNGKLDMDVTTAALGDPAPGAEKALVIVYKIGGQQLTGHYLLDDHISLGDQIVQIINPKPLPGQHITGTPIVKAAPSPGKIARLQSTIKALYIIHESSGVMLGHAEDLILTATPGPARPDTPVTFVTPVGPGMQAVLDDVLRSLRVTHPVWAAAKVDLSFEDRTTPKDGGSIGGAVGTLLLSMLNGFEIDSHVAITGDVTADGRMRAIGGVAAKLRGATAAGSAIVILPAANLDQLTDAFVYEGPSLLANLQVLGADTLTDAASLARTDRDEKIATALSLYAGIQDELKKFPEHTHLKAVQEKLEQVIAIAPNHLSAKLLLAYGQNKSPRKLSAGAALYYMLTAEKAIAPTLFDREQVAKLRTVTPVAVQEGLKSLYKLRALTPPDVLPLLDSEIKLIQGVTNVQAGRAPPQTLLPLLQAAEDAGAKLQSDRNWMEKVMNEGV